MFKTLPKESEVKQKGQNVVSDIFMICSNFPAFHKLRQNRHSLFIGMLHLHCPVLVLKLT